MSIEGENKVLKQNTPEVENGQKEAPQAETAVAEVAQATPSRSAEEIQSEISLTAEKIEKERIALNEAYANLNLTPPDTSRAIESHNARHSELVVELHASSEHAENDEQSRADKLSKYIIGLGIEDPQIADRLASDQKTIRAKYNLPNLDMKTAAPSEYESALRNIARKEGIDIRSTHEFSTFFKENPYAGAVHLGEGRVVVDVEREGSLKSYQSGLTKLEHELVHALQDKYSPRMPIEMKEYEAYLANGNMDVFKDDPKMAGVLFDMLIGGSVNHWYTEESARRGEKITPPWDTR